MVDKEKVTEKRKEWGARLLSGMTGAIADSLNRGLGGLHPQKRNQ